MMSRSLRSVKPAMAAAQPEYELSMETTTGMSPPPIASTRCAPSARATTLRMASGTEAAAWDGARTNHAMQATHGRDRAEIEPVAAGEREGRPRSSRRA